MDNNGSSMFTGKLFTVLLLLAFFCAFFIQTIAGWEDFSGWKLANKVEPNIFGKHGYVWAWLRETMRVWQADLLLLLSMSVMVQYFVHRLLEELRTQRERTNTVVQTLMNKQTETTREIEFLRNEIRTYHGNQQKEEV